MKLYQIILILFFYTGVLQSVFFAIYLFISKKGNIKANRMLGFLLLVLVMRLGKSAYIMTTHHHPNIIINVGLSGYLAIGACMLLYFRALTQPGFRLRKVDLLHFIPFALVILCSHIIPYPSNYTGAIKIAIRPWYRMYYLGLHSYLFVYLIANMLWLRRYYKSYYIQQKSISSLDKAKWIWMCSIITMVSLIWLSYTSAFLFSVPKYQTGVLIYTLLVFVLGLLALTQAQVFTQTFNVQKYKNSPLTNNKTQVHITQVKELMETEKAFKDADLTLPKLAEMLDMPTYQLSQVINEHLAKNFSDFVNQYRVNEAKQLLTDPKFGHYKIAGIAFESGFNNLSSFNTAFKKRVALTPSQYRKQHKLV